MQRLGRAVILAVLVGGVTTLVSVAPALFIQSVFIGSAQRCEEQQRFEEAAFDEVQTTCEEDLGEAPYWFPVLVIVVGGAIGAAGGFFYGFFNRPRPRGRSELAAVPRSSTGRGAGIDRSS